MSASKRVPDIVDRHLQRWVDTGLNNIAMPPHPSMAASTTSKYDDCWDWAPVFSTVTDAELTSLEIAIGHKLPAAYKGLLQHKHFYELHIGHASFFEHTPDKWLSVLLHEWYHSWPKEDLIEKGFVPFAAWEDWGLLCFDTNRNTVDVDYPILLWDHESPQELTEFSADFESALERLSFGDEPK